MHRMDPISHNNCNNATILLLQLLFLLIFISPIQALCKIRVDSNQASAIPIGTNPVYSCTPCIRGDYEVHAIQIYQPSGHNRQFRKPLEEVQTVKINIGTSSRDVTNIKLVLISYEAAKWVINSTSDVNILNVLLVSLYSPYSTAAYSSPGQRMSYRTARGYFHEWLKPQAMENYVTDTYGFLTSYTGVKETSAWSLTVGNCIILQNSPDPLDPSRKARLGGIFGGVLLGAFCLVAIIILAVRRASFSSEEIIAGNGEVIGRQTEMVVTEGVVIDTGRSGRQQEMVMDGGVVIDTRRQQEMVMDGGVVIDRQAEMVVGEEGVILTQTPLSHGPPGYEESTSSTRSTGASDLHVSTISPNPPVIGETGGAGLNSNPPGYEEAILCPMYSQENNMPSQVSVV